MRDSTARRLSSLHTFLFRVTNGRVGKRLVDNDMLLLTTTGRVTGEPHTVPLLYLRDGERLIVFASWGGRNAHPEWYLNLESSPAASVELPGVEYPVMAEALSGDERSAWWQRAVAAYSGYAEYQQKTDRQIPVLALGRSS